MDATTPYDNILPDLEYFIHRKCDASWTILRSITDFVDLTYLVEGSACYVVNGVKFTAVAGDLICIPAGSDRVADTLADSPMECYCMNLHISIGGNSVELPFPMLTHIGMRQDLKLLYKDLKSACLQRGPGYRMRVNGLILLILQRYFDMLVYRVGSEPMDGRVRKIIGTMTERYNEDIQLEDFAEQFGLNRAYLGVLFKQVTGKSFHQYLTNIRMSIAEDMLRSGEYNVGEVGQQCGYSDVYYFSKQFKKTHGIPPSKMIGKVRG